MSRDGRPRDERIDAAILDAAIDLLAEVGYTDLTIAAIADRAGTSRPAVYRRWPTKAHVIHAAIFRDADIDGVPVSGDLNRDVREMVGRIAALMTTPTARTAVPALMAEAARDPDLHAKVIEQFSSDGWRGLDGYLARKVAEGEVDSDVDAIALIEIVLGAVYFATVLRRAGRLDDTWIDRTASILVAGIRPRHIRDT